MAQCDGDISRLTDEVLSWLCDKLLLWRSARTPHPSRANGLDCSLHLDSARPTFPSRGRVCGHTEHHLPGRLRSQSAVQFFCVRPATRRHLLAMSRARDPCTAGSIRQKCIIIRLCLAGSFLVFLMTAKLLPTGTYYLILNTGQRTSSCGTCPLGYSRLISRLDAADTLRAKESAMLWLPDETAALDLVYSYPQISVPVLPPVQVL